MRFFLLTAACLACCTFASAQGGGGAGDCVFWMNSADQSQTFDGNRCHIEGVTPVGCPSDCITSVNGQITCQTNNGWLEFKDAVSETFDTAIFNVWDLPDSDFTPNTGRLATPSVYDEHLCWEEGHCSAHPTATANQSQGVPPVPSDYYCKSFIDSEYWEYEDVMERSPLGLPVYGCAINWADMDYDYYPDPPLPPLPTPVPPGTNPDPNDPSNNPPVADNGGGDSDSDYAYCGCEEGDDACLDICMYGGGDDYDMDDDYGMEEDYEDDYNDMDS